MAKLLTYLIARDAARSMDRQGIRPPRFLAWLILGTAWAMIAFVVVVVAIAVYAVATHA